MPRKFRRLATRKPPKISSRYPRSSCCTSSASAAHVSGLPIRNTVEIDYQVEQGRRFRLTDIRITGTNKITFEDIEGNLKGQEANAIGLIPFLGYGRGYTSLTLLEQDKRTVEELAVKLVPDLQLLHGPSFLTPGLNLAVALANQGKKVGLLDADLYGPSVPMMMGINKKPDMTSKNKIVPIEKYGIKLMSLGFLIPEDAPAIWRGPVVMQVITQFLRDVDWGEIDFLVVDLPPGTGDIQLTLVQTVPINFAVVVSTPQDISLIDAKKALAMFDKVSVPVFGIVENMSYFVCPHCNKRSDIFKHGGAKGAAEKLGVNFLGEIPIVEEICELSDKGEPIMTKDTAHNEVKSVFNKIADSLVLRAEQKAGA